MGSLMNMKKKKILVIDDEKSILDLIRQVLSENNEYELYLTDDAREALALLRAGKFNVVISDIRMPNLDGLSLLELISGIDSMIPVILMTGFAETEIMQRAIKLGVYDFLRKPFTLIDLIFSVRRAVQKNELLLQNENYKAHLENLVQQRTLELFSAKSKLERNFINTLNVMVNAIEASDIYTRGHSERVTVISMLFGKHVSLPAGDLKLLRIGSLLHDLGKIGIYRSILTKDITLSEDEYTMMKEHPVIGAKIVHPIGFPQEVNDIILQHHEWCNGEGYPYGIKQDTTSYLARVVSIADAFDAMISQRPYRQRLSHEEASLEITNQVGIQFDPDLSKAFCELLPRITQAVSSIKDSKAVLFQKI